MCSDSITIVPSTMVFIIILIVISISFGACIVYYCLVHMKIGNRRGSHDRREIKKDKNNPLVDNNSGRSSLGSDSNNKDRHKGMSTNEFKMMVKGRLPHNVKNKYQAPPIYE